MELVKVGVTVVNQIPLGWDHNLANILGAIADARAAGVSLLCLPELCVTGYGCEDQFASPGLLDAAWRALTTGIAPATRGMVVSVGLPIAFHKAVFNCNALCVDGRLVGLVAKRHLAADGLHYEPRWFRPWPEGPQSTVRHGDLEVPLGDLYFDVGGVKIGFEICEDAWVAARPGAALARKGVDIILNPSASHFAFGKLEVRKRLVLEGSRAFGVGYLYANLLGNEAGRAIYDGGALIAAGGVMLAIGPRFSMTDRRLTTAVIDLDLLRTAQARTGSFTPDVRDEEGDCVRAAFAWPALDPSADHGTPADPIGPNGWNGPNGPNRPNGPSESNGSAGPAQAAWERSPRLKEEEFARAEALALLDYLRKSRSGGFVVSLSGGADSAAVACLVALMVDLAVEELGWGGLLARLSHVRGLQLVPEGEAQALVGRLLTTAYQATENSGPVTRAAARTLATAIGAEHHELDVDPLLKGYRAMIEHAIGRPLDWSTDDITLQNIQARVRAPGIWMIANLKNALLLATSNRSEAAVGYATMDGDTAGGLSPIAGIDKAFLRRWLRWLETDGPDGAHAIGALAAVNRQQPTAELRPAAAHQTDEDDLMPYDLLDTIERWAIRDKQTPLEIYRRLRARPTAAAPAQLLVWLERFFRLWSRNQWKRERYAPSFHLDDENLDPKTWCRFPILSGGFERELADLRAWIARETAAPASASANSD